MSQDPFAFKVCTKCGEEKPASEFYPNMARCKTCKIAEVSAYQQTPAGRASMRRARYMFLYGLTEAQVELKLEEQGGVCAICGAERSQGRWARLSVDHDHVTGDFRGMLCLRCNSNVGWFEDNLDEVLQYLGLKVIRDADTDD